MMRLLILAVAVSCVALTNADASMDDGYYAVGDRVPEDRYPGEFYPNYSRDSPADDYRYQYQERPYNQNDVQMEFDGNLKIYGNGANRGPLGQTSRLYNVLTGYQGSEDGY